jgi:hypothetical protein
VRIVNTSVGKGLRATCAALLMTAGLGALQAPSSAQLISTPTISSIQTSLGQKNYVPALTKFQNYTLKGLNFSATASANSIKLEKKYYYMGSYFWQHVSTTNPSYATTTMLVANIGDVNPAEYRVSVTVGRSTSNFKWMVVVSNTVSLDKVEPAAQKPGGTVYLKGNLLPQTGTKVVLTPPANIATYMGTRYITPTSKTNFEIKFVVPADIWEGNWTVHVTGWMSATNKKPMGVYLPKPASYYITLKSFTCLDLSADGPGTDEIYASMLSYLPGSIVPKSDGTRDVYDGIGTGDMFENNENYYQTYDPTKPYFIVALVECDQWWWNFWGEIYWSSWIPRNEYARYHPDGIVDNMDQYLNVDKDPILLGGTPSQIAEWFRSKLATEVTQFGDECLGSKILRFTQAEVYQARLLAGKPFKKTIEFTGDSSHYIVEMHLTRY